MKSSACRAFAGLRCWGQVSSCSSPAGHVTILLCCFCLRIIKSRRLTMTGTTSRIRWAVGCLMKRCSCHWSVCDVRLFLKADLQSELGDRGYIIFGAVLFIWELLPTSLLILIFRVRQPPREKVCLLCISPCL